MAQLRKPFPAAVDGVALVLGPREQHHLRGRLNSAVHSVLGCTLMMVGVVTLTGPDSATGLIDERESLRRG